MRADQVQGVCRVKTDKDGNEITNHIPCKKCGKLFLPDFTEPDPTKRRDWCNDCLVESSEGVLDKARELKNKS